MRINREYLKNLPEPLCGMLHEVKGFAPAATIQGGSSVQAFQPVSCVIECDGQKAGTTVNHLVQLTLEKVKNNS